MFPTTIPTLADALDQDADVLRGLARDAPSLWTRRVVEKGRRVWAPAEDLKEVQKGIDRLLDRLPGRRVLDWTTTGRGVRRAVHLHCRAKSVGKVDVKQFFPSVSRDQVAELFRHLGCNAAAVELLSDLATKDGALGQGSPCLPAIAALVLGEVAPELMVEAERRGVRATSLYVDDYVVSGPRRPDVEEMLDAFARAVGRLGFAVHKRKVTTAADALVLGLRVRHSAPKSSRAARRALWRDLRRAQQTRLTTRQRNSLPGRINALVRSPAERRRLTAMIPA